jgi:hypothetical protein
LRVDVVVVPARATEGNDPFVAKLLVELRTVGFVVLVAVAVLAGGAVTLDRTGLVVPSFAAVVREASGLLAVEEANDVRVAPAVAPGARLDLLLIVVPVIRLDKPFAAAGFFSLPDAS